MGRKKSVRSGLQKKVTIAHFHWYGHFMKLGTVQTWTASCKNLSCQQNVLVEAPRLVFDEEESLYPTKYVL